MHGLVWRRAVAQLLFLGMTVACTPEHSASGTPAASGEHRSSSALSVGTGQLGQSCGANTDCAEGTLCVHSGDPRPHSGWACQARCGNDAGPCPNGYSCVVALPGDVTSGLCLQTPGVEANQ
jgi:hypothetical protein